MRSFSRLAGMIITAGLIPAFLCPVMAADIPFPHEPKAPDVALQETGYGKDALVTFEGGGVRSYHIEFRDKELQISAETGSRRNRTVLIDEIRMFHIQRWKQVRFRGEMVFVPSKIEITLNDGTVYYADSSLDMLRKLKYRTEKKSGYLYTFFYDYWQKGKWMNSGSNDPAYPQEHPVRGTVTEIRFEKPESQGGLLEILGKSLDKRSSR